MLYGTIHRWHYKAGYLLTNEWQSRWKVQRACGWWTKPSVPTSHSNHVISRREGMLSLVLNTSYSYQRYSSPLAGFLLFTLSSFSWFFCHIHGIEYRFCLDLCASASAPIPCLTVHAWIMIPILTQGSCMHFLYSPACTDARPACFLTLMAYTCCHPSSTHRHLAQCQLM